MIVSEGVFFIGERGKGGVMLFLSYMLNLLHTHTHTAQREGEKRERGYIGGLTAHG